jgi:hypothetical protein
MTPAERIKYMAGHCGLTVEELSARIDSAKGESISVPSTVQHANMEKGTRLPFWISIATANEVLAELFLQQ